MKNQQLIEAIIKAVSNKKQHDKTSISYMIGMMDSNNFYGSNLGYYSTREQLLKSFIELINTDKIYRLKDTSSFKLLFEQYKTDYSKPIAKSEFTANLILEYSSTPIPTQLGEATNTMEFYLHDESEQTGYIIWDYELKGEMDEEVIGLWFEDGKLTDYDGVFELPKEAIALIESAGYNADYAKDDSYTAPVIAVIITPDNSYVNTTREEALNAFNDMLEELGEQPLTESELKDWGIVAGLTNKQLQEYANDYHSELQSERAEAKQYPRSQEYFDYSQD